MILLSVRSWLAVTAGGFLLGLVACSPPPSPALPVPDSVPVPNPQNVESVLFLIGDAGNAVMETSPTLARLQQDVEQWAGSLTADSAVAVFYLGDARYPEGVRPKESSFYASDSTVVISQARVVAGPVGQQRRAHTYFMAGNHDWGLRQDWDGFVRLINLRTLLDESRQATGLRAVLVPEPGTGGPFVVDWGAHVRLIMLDTAWWLLQGNVPEKVDVLAGVDTAMAGARGREVMILTHHPFDSAGPHGGQFSFWRTIGARYLLHRAGAILQDLSSIPFRQLTSGFLEIFGERGPPLAFIAGHDHSLQVLSQSAPNEPKFNIVSGAGSKLTEVGRSSRLLFGHASPGYMRLVIERNGGMLLFVEAVPADFQVCPDGEPERTTCMAEGIAAFRTVYWMRLK